MYTCNMVKIKNSMSNRKKTSKDVVLLGFTNGDANNERQNVIQWLNALFDSNKHLVTEANYIKFQELNPSLNIEKGIYNAALERAMRTNTARKWSNPRFLDIYRQRKLSIITNLDPTSYVNNRTLLQRLMNQEMLPHMIAFLKPTELFPERWETFLHEHAKEQAKGKYIPTGFYTQYKCGKCGEKKTSITEVQIRSADEPMTQFITCIVCGHKWRR